MTATAKTAYTQEQTVELVAAYGENPTSETVAMYAEKFGKTVKSVIAKLSREGVYKKKEYVGKTGEKPVKKEELATEFMDLFGLSDAEADSIAKANKTALKKILDKVKVLMVEPEAAEG